MTRKFLLSLAVAAAFTIATAATPEQAEAQYAAHSGYVCQVNYYQSSYNVFRGAEGAVYVDLYNGPGCTGGRLATGWMCTTGASTSYCPSSGHYYTAEELRLLLPLLTAHMTSALRVNLTYSGSQITIVAFRVN